MRSTRTTNGLSELEEAYGMDLSAPNKGEAPRDTRGLVRYRQGYVPTTEQLVGQRKVSDVRANGGTANFSRAIAASRIGPDVAIVTVRIPTGGYRCVAVATGGSTLELFRAEGPGMKRARAAHDHVVKVVCEYLDSEQIVDFTEPLMRVVRRRF